jgi:peptide deformylase
MTKQILNSNYKIVQNSSKEKEVLHKRAKSVKIMSSEIQKLAQGMIQAMKNADGVGLAAPQVGKSLRIFVIDEAAFWEPFPVVNAAKAAGDEQPPKEEPKPNFRFLKGSPDLQKALVFINPEVTYLSREKILKQEGCLSLMEPEEIRATVERSKKAIIKAHDVAGNKFKLQAKGLLARVIQHETDHINGILITDKAIQIIKVENQRKKI